MRYDLIAHTGDPTGDDAVSTAWRIEPDAGAVDDAFLDLVASLDALWERAVSQGTCEPSGF